MHLGIDFDGTIVEYLVCYRHGAGDGSVLRRFNTQEKAEELLAYKRKLAKPERTFWIMRITHKYERITDMIETTAEEK